MSTNLVLQLKKGSKRIDQRKEDIDFILKMLDSFLRGRYETREAVGFSVLPAKTGYTWMAQTTSRWYVIQCLQNTDIIYTYGVGVVSSLHVRGAHEALDPMVEHLFRVFPELMERWKPLLDAGAENE